jgi:hypothetical protein
MTAGASGFDLMRLLPVCLSCPVSAMIDRAAGFWE